MRNGAEPSDASFERKAKQARYHRDADLQCIRIPGIYHRIRLGGFIEGGNRDWTSAVTGFVHGWLACARARQPPVRVMVCNINNLHKAPPPISFMRCLPSVNTLAFIHVNIQSGMPGSQAHCAREVQGGRAVVPCPHVPRADRSRTSSGSVSTWQAGIYF